MQGALKYCTDIDAPRSPRNQKHPFFMLIGTTLLASHDTYQRLWDAIAPSQCYKSCLLFTASLKKLTQILCDSWYAHSKRKNLLNSSHFGNENGNANVHERAGLFSCPGALHTLHAVPLKMISCYFAGDSSRSSERRLILNGTAVEFFLLNLAQNSKHGVKFGPK